jgi:type I restriction enzyme M protein
MNMVLHDCPTAEIWKGNTLSSPHFLNADGSLKTFDYVVANPPFSDKAWSTGVFDEGKTNLTARFMVEGERPPEKNGDFAYLLHVIASLKSTGKGAVILPHGVLFRGNAESTLRRWIVKRGYIKGIIGLPANLFYGTGIPACIVVLDIHKIVDAFTKQAQIDKYSRMVPLAEIEKNDFNLNIPRYIDASEPEDLQDIEAHLKGGIPVRDVDALEDFWQVVPAVRHDIFAPGERPGYLTPMVEAAEVKPAILNHAEFAAYADTVTEVFDAWRAAHIDRLRGIDIGDKPKDLIHVISEDLLDRFKPVPLIDGYDVYQHLMTYWSEVMQDDVYVLVQDGWKAGRVIRELVKNAEGKFTETPDITLGRRKLKAELIPPALIVARFFASEKAALEALEAKAEEAARAIEELDEEHGGEDGLLADAKTEKGKLTAKSVKDRIKDIRHDRDAAEEMAILKQALGLIEAEAAAARAVKEAQAALDEATVRHYAKLTGDQLKALIVEDKWLARLQGDVAAEVDRVSQALAGRVKLLTERYAAPLLVLEDRAQALGAKVAEHLKRMGFAA